VPIDTIVPRSRLSSSAFIQLDGESTYGFLVSVPVAVVTCPVSPFTQKDRAR
jgi:hypothetical protein